MKITLSKSQWELIGKRAGWIKTASVEDMLKIKAAIEYVKKIGDILDSLRLPYKFAEEKNHLIALYTLLFRAFPSVERYKAQPPIGITAKKKEQSNEELIETYLKFKDNGRANEKNITEKNVDSNELAIGIKVEYEHTTDKETAERIALDHLAELKDYYTRLKKMEEQGKKEGTELK